LGEAAGRLVEDQEEGLPGEGAGDLDQLLLGGAEAADGGAGVEAEVEAVEEGAGVAVEAGPIDDARGAGRFAAEEDVAGDVEGGDEAELLVDHGDAKVLGGLGRGNGDRLAGELNHPFVRLVDAIEDLHQGRLAGAILADQGVDLAAGDLEVDPLEGANAGERFGDALDAEGGGWEAASSWADAGAGWAGGRHAGT
jgi:hypothetical protein